MVAARATCMANRVGCTRSMPIERRYFRLSGSKLWMKIGAVLLFMPLSFTSLATAGFVTSSTGWG